MTGKEQLEWQRSTLAAIRVLHEGGVVSDEEERLLSSRVVYVALTASPDDGREAEPATMSDEELRARKSALDARLDSLHQDRRAR